MSSAIDVDDLQKQLTEVKENLQQVEDAIEDLLCQQAELRTKKDRLIRILRARQTASKADLSHGSFSWDARVLQILAETYKLASFRPLQREVINATLQKRDVLCLMPSGGGKSLCYQLPALVGTGMTLVVSPLLSLINDQVYGLRAMGVAAAALTSQSSKDNVNAVYERMDGKDSNDSSAGPLQLLYVTPEKIVSSKRFMAKLEKLHQAGRLARIAIDEVHCVSAYGNDFRPDYKKLGILKQQFPDVPIIALTATATHQVCEDLKNVLRIEGCEVFQSSVNRPNLFYEVQPKPATAADVAKHIANWIQMHYPKGDTGIVYCLTRKDCEQMASELQQAAICCSFYHADMEATAREQAHHAWSSGRVQVICATIAFGMGINKPDVCWVIHASISKSLENYYQESGRAGRDGQPARCLLLYRFSDVLRQAAITCFETNWHSNLMSMARYAASVGQCRRADIQRHFQEAPADCRYMCDVCCTAHRVAQQDITPHARTLLKILRKLASVEKKATLLQLIDAWRSSKELAASKLAKAMSKDANELVVQHLLLQDLLRLDFGHTAYATNTYLQCSNLGVALLSGTYKQPVILKTLEVQDAPQEEVEQQQWWRRQQQAAGFSAGAAGQAADDTGQPALLALLQTWRQHAAQAADIFPFCVVPAQALKPISCLKAPASMQDLIQLIGEKKATAWGDDILHVLTTHQLPLDMLQQPSAEVAVSHDTAPDAVGSSRTAGGAVAQQQQSVLGNAGAQQQQQQQQQQGQQDRQQEQQKSKRSKRGAKQHLQRKACAETHEVIVLDSSSSADEQDDFVTKPKWQKK